MKRGEAITYGSSRIYRLKTRAFFERDAFYIFTPDGTDTDVVFRTESSAKARIQFLDERARRRLELQAQQPLPVIQIGFPLMYRSYTVELISEDEDGRQTFTVSGMGDKFESLGEALRRINWARNSLENIENASPFDARGWKRNAEK